MGNMPGMNRSGFEPGSAEGGMGGFADLFFHSFRGMKEDIETILTLYFSFHRENFCKFTNLKSVATPQPPQKKTFSLLLSTDFQTVVTKFGEV